jgi:hypothetical protein
VIPSLVTGPEPFSGHPFAIATQSPLRLEVSAPLKARTALDRSPPIPISKFEILRP